MSDEQWLKLFEIRAASRDRIERIHRGSELTSEMLARSRTALEHSEKLLQESPPPTPAARYNVRRAPRCGKRYRLATSMLEPTTGGVFHIFADAAINLGLQKASKAASP